MNSDNRAALEPQVIPVWYQPHTKFGVPMAEIKAHITGTIWKIKVAVGDKVEEGDTLVIIESMKMEMPIEAMDPGTVTEIRCKEAEAVAEGVVLLVIED